MAKKVSTSGKYIHKDCKNCKEVLHEFLSIKGYPIMGECEFCETRFLLREGTDCEYFKRV